MSKKKSKGSLESEAPQPREKVEVPEVDEVAKEKAVAKAVENLHVPDEAVSEPESLDEPVEKVAFEALSKEERDALTKRAKEKAAKESKEAAEEKFLKAEVARFKKEEDKKYNLSVDEETVRHTVNLSSAADHMLINGKQYKQGHTYEVPQSLHAAMLDIEFRGHQQERLRKGQDLNEYGLRERGGVKSGSGLVKA
jgi:hypothetical protein